MTDYLDTARTDSDSTSDHVDDHNALHRAYNYDNVGVEKWLLPDDDSDVDISGTIAWDSDRNLWISSSEAATIDFEVELQNVAWLEAIIVCSIVDLNEEAQLIVAEDNTFAQNFGELKWQADENIVAYNGVGSSQGAIPSGTGSFNNGAIFKAKIVYVADWNLVGVQVVGAGLESDFSSKKYFGSSVSTSVTSGDDIGFRIRLDSGWGVVKARAGTY